MIKKRSVQYKSRKSSLCRRGNSYKGSSASKKSADNSFSSKRFLFTTESCIGETGVKNDVTCKRGRTIQKESTRNCSSLKFSDDIISDSGTGRSLENAAGVNGSGKDKRRKQRKRKALVLDEASRLQRRTRYLIIRMKSEQNLIDAYSAEGWKGQSREKIKPEKELQRARKQILNCKLGIRDAIHQLELLSSEGCIEDSVIFPDGSVHHEHIFCAKCKSAEAFVDNDIVLCDGTCNCAFHQKCLDPPLAKNEPTSNWSNSVIMEFCFQTKIPIFYEQKMVSIQADLSPASASIRTVPPGDQGWFCKFCECKIEILEAINAHLGTFFSVDSSWEDIFKESVSSLNGGNLYLNPTQEWPSEDSEDDDYNPEINEKSRSMERIEDNILDDASISYSLSFFSDEGSIESRKLDGDHEGNSYKRQRRDVDYKKLYAEMFGKDQHENEQSEDEDWGPRRRKQRKLTSDGGTYLDSCSGDYSRPKSKFTGEMEKKLSSTLQERKRFLRIPRNAVEKLRQVFVENELPSRAVKEELSKQLGLTCEKVNKWFKNARYSALKIRKANRTEVLSNYIKLSTKNRKNGSSSEATLKGRHGLLASSSEIHKTVRKNLWKMTLKSIIPSLRKRHNRMSSAPPSITTKKSRKFSHVKFSKKGHGGSATLENNHSKVSPPYHSSNGRGNKQLYLNELERLCNLYEKVYKLKTAVLSAYEGCATNTPPSTAKQVIYVPVAELKEKVVGSRRS